MIIEEGGMKIIIVENCMECPYSEEEYTSRRCTHPSCNGKDVGDDSISGLCPLEEAP